MGEGVLAIVLEIELKIYQLKIYQLKIYQLVWFGPREGLSIEHLLPSANVVCEGYVFTLSVCPQWVCVAGGCAWQGVCMAGGMCGKGQGDGFRL